MKRLQFLGSTLLCLLALLSLLPRGAGAAPAAFIPPDSAGILYPVVGGGGDWLVTHSAAKTINSGAYFRTLLNTTHTCGVGLDIGPATPYSQCWARMDSGQWQQYVPTAGGAQTWTLAMPTGTTAARHLLEFVVKSTTETHDRWNTQATAVQFTGLTLDPGASVSLPARRKYLIYCFGDSITEGVRVNGYAGIANDTDRNDVLQDYSYHLGELLDAEIVVVGFGATGLTTGGSGNVPALTESYRLFWAGQPRSFAVKPDLVIYNEGTNEAGATSAAMAAALRVIISGIGDAGRTQAGLSGTRHLVLRPFGGYQAENLKAAADSYHSGNVAYGDTTGFWSPADSSDGLHPYGYAHLSSLAPRIAALALPLLSPGAATAPPRHS